jgi:CheY-like chemotaxis protein
VGQRRILIVDDEADARRLIVDALRDRELQVDEATDDATAIELLRENRYSVVLVDLLMPGGGGLAVLEAIAEDKSAPVVLVISGADRHVIRRVHSSRIHGIVKRPFDPIELAEIVGACAEIRARSAFETMAYATIIGGAPIIAMLVK